MIASLCGLLVILQVISYVLFSGDVRLVPASLAVHSLTQVVHLCVVVWACVVYVCECIQI